MDERRAKLDQLYESQAACDAELDSFRVAVRDAQAAEKTNQDNHLNHRRERKRTVVCYPPHSPAKEEECGIDLVVGPDGDFF